MFRNYIKIAYRNLLRNRVYTSINIFGLTIGFTSFIIISLFVLNELSFDRFLTNSNDIYRVIKTNLGSSFSFDRLASTPDPLDDLLMEEYSEVQFATQLTKAESFLELDNNIFDEQGIYADDHFFDVFEYPFIQGNSDNALKKPNSIIITKDLALKFFGRLDVIGKTVYVSHKGEFFSGRNIMEITGILDNPPKISHIDFDYVVPTRSSEELVNYMGDWNSNHYLTYIRLQPGTSKKEFEPKISDFERRHSTSTNFANGELSLQPIVDIHLYSNIFGEFKPNGNISAVYLLGSLAIIILLIACINYTNLATAQSFMRVREVGVRKAIGANERQLVAQFISESLFLSIIALLFAFAFAEFLLPVFNEISSSELKLNLSDNIPFFIFIILFGLLIGMLAGSYPAFKISKNNPSQILKGIDNLKEGRSSLKNLLIIFQFTATTCLIIATITVFNQLNFIRNADTGVESSQVISITIEDQNLYEKYSILKSQLERNSEIELVSAAQNRPIAIDSSSPLTKWEGSSEDKKITVYRSAIQHDYIELFDIEIIEGRDFVKDISSDLTQGMLINESLKDQLNWDVAVGKRMTFRGRDAVVTGVVKDFNYRSFHKSIEPLALFLENDWWFPYQNIFVKINTENTSETIRYIENTLREFSPNYPFEFQFLDDTFNNVYKSELRIGKLINYFTIIAIFISCLGVFGLAAFSISRRNKEIGLRKILGASVQNIVSLLSVEYLKPVIIGFLIATPISWYGLTIWLQNFAYKIDLGITPFIIAGFSILCIALITVSSHCIKAALTNPVECLRNE